LLRDGFARKDVVVAHPNHIEKFIGPETEVIGTYEMDPLGMGLELKLLKQELEVKLK
jgi:hypothetical protein